MRRTRCLGAGHSLLAQQVTGVRLDDHPNFLVHGQVEGILRGQSQVDREFCSAAVHQRRHDPILADESMNRSGQDIAGAQATRAFRRQQDVACADSEP